MSIKESSLNLIKSKVESLKEKAIAFKDSLRAAQEKYEIEQKRLHELTEKKKVQTELVNQQCRTKECAEEELVKYREIMTQHQNQLEEINKTILDLQERAQQLEESSKLSPEIQAALDALDRRQLSEISKLGKPPSTVQQALEIVWIFIDMFENTNKDTGMKGIAGDGGADEKREMSPPRATSPTRDKSVREKSSPPRATSPTRDRSAREKSSPPRATSPTRDKSAREKSPPRATSPTRDKSTREKSSPPRATSPTRDKSAREKSSPQKDNAAKLAQVRTWPELRKQMAVDLHPHIAAIQVNFIAEDRNEAAVMAIKEKIDALDTSAVTRASKPTGVLYMWCKALIECALSIRAKLPLQTELNELKMNQQPSLNDEAYQAKLLFEEKETVMKDLTISYDAAIIDLKFIEKEHEVSQKYFEDLEIEVKQIASKCESIDKELLLEESLLKEKEEEESMIAMAQKEEDQNSIAKQEKKVELDFGELDDMVSDRVAFAKYINTLLALPNSTDFTQMIDPFSKTSLYHWCKDGLLLSKLINLVEAGTIDERALNQGEVLSDTEFQENANLVINAAAAIGCCLTNNPSSVNDLSAGKASIVLELLWEILKQLFAKKLTTNHNPKLILLLEEEEDPSVLTRLPVHLILIRWVNFHLKRNKASEGGFKQISNFGVDVIDSEVYDILLKSLGGEKCASINLQQGNDEKASEVLQNVVATGIKEPLLVARDISDGNEKLNLCLVFQLYCYNDGFDNDDSNEAERLSVQFQEMMVETIGQASDVGSEMSESFEEVSTDDREEKTFRNWINSLALKDSEDKQLIIKDLYYDLCAGLPILRIMDKIEPGIVPWKKTHAKPKGRLQMVDNCNLVVTLAKQMDLVVVNIGGVDIMDRNKMLILAIIWQLMRRYTLDLLKTLSLSRQGHSHSPDLITEKEVIQWANEKVTSDALGDNEPITTPIKHLNDKLLSDGIFLLRICAAIKPTVVNWQLVRGSPSDDLLKKENARYAISVARKLGACVFITPDDILQAKPKMLFTFIAALWVESLKA